MRLYLGLMAAGFLVGAAMVGCGPTVSENDLGTIVYEVPTVAGADEPYPFPKLPPPAPGSEAERRMKRRGPPGPPPGMMPPGAEAPKSPPKS